MVESIGEIAPTALYTLKEAAAYLRISDATARRWVKHGLLRGRKVGRDYRIVGSDLATSVHWADVHDVTSPRPLDADDLSKITALGESELTDVAEKHDDYLFEIYRYEAR